MRYRTDLKCLIIKNESDTYVWLRKAIFVDATDSCMHRFLSNFALALKNRGCREFTVLNIYFLLFRIFEQLALALQNRAALKIFTVLNIFFIIQGFWAICTCPENRVCPENFQARGAAAPPPPPRLVRLWLYVVYLCHNMFAQTNISSHVALRFTQMRLETIAHRRDKALKTSCLWPH